MDGWMDGWMDVSDYHLTFPRKFPKPSLAYMYTKCAKGPFFIYNTEMFAKQGHENSLR